MLWCHPNLYCFRVIDQLRNALKTKELVLEQTEEEKKDIAKETRLPLENKIKQLDRQLEVKDREVQVGHVTRIGRLNWLKKNARLI